MCVCDGVRGGKGAVREGAGKRVHTYVCCIKHILMHCGKINLLAKTAQHGLMCYICGWQGEASESSGTSVRLQVCDIEHSFMYLVVYPFR